MSKNKVMSTKEQAPLLKIAKIQENFIDDLNEKFPLSMKMIFNLSGGKENFIKKGFLEKKELIVGFLKKNGIQFDTNESGADMHVVNNDGTELVGFIGRNTHDELSNFYNSLNLVLPVLESQLW